MTCDSCEREKSATLLDGSQVCTWCDHWRHECEANAILHFPTLQARRAQLYGGVLNGRPFKGVRGLRGEAAVKRLEKTMMALHLQRKNNGSNT